MILPFFGTQMTIEAVNQHRMGMIAESYPLLIGWLLFLFVLMVSRIKVRYKVFRFPLFVLLFASTFIRVTEIWEVARLRGVGFFVFGFGLSWLIAQFLIYASFNLLLDKRRGQPAPALMKTLTFYVLVFMVLLLLNELLPDNMRFDPTSVVASAAVLSVVLGFALQETLGNLFSGLALHMQSPIKVGQWVRIGETTGKVVEMDWRAVKIRTLSFDYHIIPNARVATNPIINFNDPPGPHRRELLIRAPYSASPDIVRAAILPIVQNHPDVEKSPAPMVILRGFQEHWIDYEVRYWYADFSKLEPLDGEIRRQVWYHFRRERIEHPVPYREVHQYLVSQEQQEEEETRIEELKKWLRHIPMFNALSPAEIDQIAIGMTPALYAAGESIIRQGSEGDSFYLLFKGEAEVRVSQDDGLSQVVKLLRRGDYFGEMALLTGQARTATITAISESACYILDKNLFQTVLRANPAIAESMSAILAERQAELQESISELEGRSRAVHVEEKKQDLLARIRNYFGL